MKTSIPGSGLVRLPLLGWFVFAATAWVLLVGALRESSRGWTWITWGGLGGLGFFSWEFRRRERERERLRSAWQHSEERHRQLFEHSLAAILVLDSERRFRDANQAGLELLGYSRTELLGRCFADVDAGPYGKAPVSPEPGAAGLPIDGEHQLRRKDGATRVVSGKSLPETAADGSLLGTTSILLDITGTRAADEARRQSERRLSLFFNQSLDGYYFSELETPQEWSQHTDKDRVLEYIRTHQRITEVNDAMLAQYGASREEFLGRPVAQFFEHDVEEGRRLHRQLCDQGRLHVETCERRDDGTTIWIEGDYVCIFDADHRITGTFGIQRDITRRKQAEEARAQLEAQLRHSQKLEAVGQLAGGVAHDFNNILAALMMNLGLMQRDAPLSPTTRAGLQEMEPLIDRASTLVRQLLLFARRGVMHFQILDLNELVLRLLKMLQRLIGAHIRLLVPEGRLALWVRADPGMLEQVVTNLVVNARDALPQGGQIEILMLALTVDATHVATHPEARPGAFICLAVRDNGTGMEETTLERLFEPFFTTKDVGRGTGLGLSTVQGIVQQHEGWIEVDSTPGRGSTFRVYLPAVAPPDSTNAPETAASPHPVTLPSGHETLLLAEDEASVREAMARTLERQGFRVLQAGDGATALRIWAVGQPRVDLLLADVVMPEGIDGFALAAKLRESRPSLPVLLLTGYSAELMKRGNQLPGETRFLQKPCSPRELLGTIRQMLDAEADAGASRVS